MLVKQQFYDLFNIKIREPSNTLLIMQYEKMLIKHQSYYLFNMTNHPIKQQFYYIY